MHSDNLEGISDLSSFGGLRVAGDVKKSTDSQPLITVVTVVFNGQKFIEKTILSVIGQTYSNVEYVVIDGGSSDSTLAIIKEYTGSIDFWLSEKDSGIYDAMNKGINQASGDWIVFMNAGDWFVNKDILRELVLPAINKNYNCSLLSFSVKYDTGEVVKPSFNSKIKIHNTIPHQGAVYSKKLFDDFLYDSTLKILSDYELNLLVYIKNIPAYVSESILSICSEGGISRTDYRGVLKEANIVRSRYFSKPYSLFLQCCFYAKLFFWRFLSKRH